MVEIHCGDDGAAAAAAMRSPPSRNEDEAPRTVADALEAEGYELAAESAVAAPLLEEQERAEADAWYRENAPPDEGDSR